MMPSYDAPISEDQFRRALLQRLDNIGATLAALVPRCEATSKWSDGVKRCSLRRDHLGNHLWEGLDV